MRKYQFSYGPEIDGLRFIAVIKYFTYGCFNSLPKAGIYQQDLVSRIGFEPMTPSLKGNCPTNQTP